MTTETEIEALKREILLLKESVDKKKYAIATLKEKIDYPLLFTPVERYNDFLVAPPNPKEGEIGRFLNMRLIVEE